MDPLINPAFLLFAAVAPLLISLIKQSGLSTQVNALIALACYVVVGVGAVLVSGEALTLENASALITIATVVGTAAYNLIWNNLGVTDSQDQSLEDRLTAATSFIK